MRSGSIQRGRDGPIKIEIEEADQHLTNNPAGDRAQAIAVGPHGRFAYEQLPKLFSHNPGMAKLFEESPDLAEATAKQTSAGRAPT